MKTIDKFAILCILAAAVAACGGQKDPDPVIPDDPTETRTLTFVLPGFTAGEGEELPAGVKTAWAAGDQIVVHGEYAKDQVTVTLDAGDISGDGKTATKKVDGLRPYTREDCASVLYASYPASVADNLKHCFFYSKFSTTNAQLLAGCNSGDTFQMQNICGMITFQVEGDYEAYELSSPKKDALGYEFLQVKLTDNVSNYKQYLGEPILKIEGAMNGTIGSIYVPDGTVFRAGYTLKLKKGGKWIRILRTHDRMEVDRGTVLNLGDITDEIEPYEDPFDGDVHDIDTQGNANCYIVTAPGTYKFKAVVGNKATQYLEDVDKAEVLWETWNDLSEVTPGSVIASASYAEDFIVFRTPDTLKPGNAVIAAYGLDGSVLWSWHIWVPKTAIQTAAFGGALGNDAMDRNLGALVVTEAGSSPIDPLSYGMVYQWGRKDPFTGAGAFNKNTYATYTGEAEEVAAGKISIEESIAKPRLLGHIDNGDWTIDLDNNYWTQSDKTIYDPCPAGYRVPYNTAGSLWAADVSAQAGWGIDATNGWLKVGDAVFPIAGYRDDYSVGGITKVGVRTLYWFAKAASDTAGAGADLRQDKGTYKFGSAPKARLGSVRCVVE